MRQVAGQKHNLATAEVSFHLIRSLLSDCAYVFMLTAWFILWLISLAHLAKQALIFVLLERMLR